MSYTFGRIVDGDDELLEVVTKTLNCSEFLNFIKTNINNFNEQDPNKIKDKIIEIVTENFERFSVNDLDIDFDLNLADRLDKKVYNEIKNNEREEVLYSHADVNAGKLIFKAFTFVNCKSFYIDNEEYEEFKVPSEIGITLSKTNEDYALFVSYMLEEEFDENNNPKYEIHMLL